MEGVIDLDELLEHWEGHRRLTRRTIAAFPDDELFSHRVEPLRSFGEMIGEALEVTPLLEGIANDHWEWRLEYEQVKSKAELLEAWDESLRSIREYWPSITGEKLERVEPDHFFGGPAQSNLARLLYQIDNEIHHRAQGYVYLRQLGIEPPPFYER
ncbi:MAG TPA: DinB family protein [Trueperaceae bacterium]